MSGLSPATQAVFWAFNSKFDWIEDGVPGPQYKAIAAALRAAADQLQERKPRLNIGIDWSCSELYAIADELEAQ